VSEEPAGPATPAWGTPSEPVPGGRPDVPAGGGERFAVLVEQNRGSSGDFCWSPVETGAVFRTREAARAEALGTCRRFDPKHPHLEQRRTVYRVSPDEYVVAVEGMTAVFHFRVTVAEVV